MDKSLNSQPLLQVTSDSDDIAEDDRNNERWRTDSPGYSGRQSQETESDPNDMQSTTDECDDDTENLCKADNTVPNDRFGFTYVVFYLLGMTTLVSWNFFITAEDYWMYKFRNVTSNSTTEITPIQATFTSDLSFSASIPNTLFLILNAFFGHLIPVKYRMNGSMLIVLLFFASNTALVKVNTDQWQDRFFDITIGSVIVMNVATAIISGGLFGISGLFPSEYITAVVSGQALGGVLTAICEIITLTFATDAITSAFIFFNIGNGILVLSIITYIMVSRTPFYRYYTVDKLIAVKEGHRQRRLSRMNSMGTNRNIENIVVDTKPNFKVVLNKMWLYGFTEWLVFTVSLSVYPSVTVLVNSQNHGNGHPWNDIYFVPVTNYLIFNCGDYLGRILAGMLEWPNNKPHIVALLSILRIGFLPALLLCNTNPRHRVPVFIHSDYIFILLMCFFAFTNGYLANIAMIWAPKSVHSHEKEMSSSMMAAFLGIGLAFGSTLSLIIVQFL